MTALLTKKQAAKFLGVSYAIVSNLVYDGKLKRRKIGCSEHGRSWRITLASLQEYVNGADEQQPQNVPRWRTFEEAFPHLVKNKRKSRKTA
jgi:excisionase family DNA binding protein